MQFVGITFACFYGSLWLILIDYTLYLLKQMEVAQLSEAK